jgi:SP family sugar:H+ symporter-like MFS transporter
MRNSTWQDEGVDSQVLRTRADQPEFGKDVDYNHEALPSANSDGVATQAGVKRIEAVSKAWTKTSLIIAYIS